MTAIEWTEPTREDIRVILPQLYEEIRHRREITWKFASAYLAVCGLSAGWVATDFGALSLGVRGALALVLGVLGVFLINNMNGQARAYFQIARVIVALSDRLGFYETVYPATWRDWGKADKLRPWWAFLLVMLSTCLFVLFGGAA